VSEAELDDTSRYAQAPQQPTFGWLIIFLWLVDVMRSDQPKWLVDEAFINQPLGVDEGLMRNRLPEVVDTLYGVSVSTHALNLSYLVCCRYRSECCLTIHNAMSEPALHALIDPDIVAQNLWRDFECPVAILRSASTFFKSAWLVRHHRN
jgi:hypothetical protein